MSNIITVPVTRIRDFNGKLYYKSQPKQSIFHYQVNKRAINGYREFLFGGALFGGKSMGLRWQAHCELITNPGITGLLLRGSLPELKRTHIKNIHKDLPKGYGRYNGQDHVFKYVKRNPETLQVDREFGLESTLEFGYGEHERDFAKYLSAEYDFIMIDELTTLPFDFFMAIKTRLRTSTTGYIPFLAAATNPGSKSHSEVKAYFIDKDFAERYPDPSRVYQPEKIYFLKSTIYDNPAGMGNNPGYIDMLRSQSEEYQKRFLEGDWDIFEGQFFGSFRKNLHVIKPFDIPKNWKKFAGLDYGNVTVAEYIAYDKENDAYYVFGEWVIVDTPKETEANYCYEYMNSHGLMDIILHHDSNFDAVSKEVPKSKTPAAEFRKRGIKLMPAVKKGNTKEKRYRIMCNREIKNLLEWKNDENGLPIKKPKLYIFETCKYLVRSLPALIFDENDDEDLDTDGDDHAYDALKMGIMSHRRGFDPEKQKRTAKAVMNMYQNSTI